MADDMVGKADVAVFDSIPVDLIQRIAAMVPYTTDTSTRRLAALFCLLVCQELLLYVITRLQPS